MNVHRRFVRASKPLVWLFLFGLCLDLLLFFIGRIGVISAIIYNIRNSKPHWSNQPEEDFRVIVLAYNRPESLARCLSSLNDAEYENSDVIVDIWLDRSKENGKIDEKTYTAAATFKFQHGKVHVHNHTKHVGVYGQWLNTWDPDEKSREIAFFLEDDVTVSKHFYKWLKAVHRRYDSHPRINGYSTQGVSMKHSGEPGNLRGPHDQFVFVYPVLGTWGFSPKLRHWRNFTHWYKIASKAPSFQPLVPDILPSVWYTKFLEKGKTDTMWSMWHIYYAWTNNELTLYPNFPHKAGFSINWRENGLHYKNHPRKKYALLQDWRPEYIMFPDVPVELDFSGHVVS